MDTLDRLLLKDFLVFFAIILSGLALLFLGIDFFSKFWKLNLDTGTLFALYSYKIPDALYKFVPVASLMATLAVLTNMSRQNEILALYAGGISTFRISSTLIAIVSVICTVSFLVFDHLVPACQKKQILIEKGLKPSEEHLIMFAPDRYWYRSGNLLYNVGRFIQKQNRLEDIDIYFVNDKFDIVKKIRAQRGTYVNNDWLLENGFMVEYSNGSNYPIATQFDKKTGIIPEPPAHFKKFALNSMIYRLKDLRHQIQRNQSYGLDTTGQELNYHERLALVFTPLIFVLIGIPYSIKPLKQQSIAKGVAFSFLVVFFYLIVFRFSLTMGKSGHIPPVLAGWLANIIFLFYSIFVLSRR